MNRNLKKAFTLVEMLIVVIIIGILIGALFPKLKGAQGAARDTSRQVALGNIGTALFQYQSEEWVYPEGACTSDLEDDLEKYLSAMPSDPQAKRKTYGTKDGGCTSGSFAYAPMYNAGTEAGGYVLVANTESEWKKSNFVLPNQTLVFTWNTDTKLADFSSPVSTIQDARDLDVAAVKFWTAWADWKIYDSRLIPILSCKEGVDIIWDGDEQTMCKNGLVDKWKTTVANNMTYVVSQ